jgi:hypothetical protein
MGPSYELVSKIASLSLPLASHAEQYLRPFLQEIESVYEFGSSKNLSGVLEIGIPVT